MLKFKNEIYLLQLVSNYVKSLYNFIVIVLLSLSLTGFAQDTAIFSSDNWDGFTNIDGSGLYWDIIRHVYEQNGVTVAFETSSYTRSVELLRHQKSDALVGSYLDEQDFTQYPKYPIDIDYVSACTSVSFKNKFSINILPNYSVAWIKGYGFEKILNIKLNYLEIENRKIGLTLVANQRIDFYIDAESDIKIYLNNEPKLAAKLICKLIHKEKIFLTFNKTLFGDKLKNIWDTTIPKLIKSGYIEQKFKEYDLKPMPYNQ